MDGVSLTVAQVLRDGDVAGSSGIGFEIALIPETLERTTLEALQVGSRVNLEADAMAKMVAAHVERLLSAREQRPQA